MRLICWDVSCLYYFSRYYEFEAMSAGLMRVGWAQPSISAEKDLATTGKAYLFDGFLVRKQLRTISPIEIEPGERWARPPSVASVDGQNDHRVRHVYGKMSITWHKCMAKWQDVSAHRPFLVCSLANDDVIVWRNIFPYTHNKNGVCASIKMVSQRNRTHNETLSVLRVLFLWSHHVDGSALGPVS